MSIIKKNMMKVGDSIFRLCPNQLLNIV